MITPCIKHPSIINDNPDMGNTFTIDPKYSFTFNAEASLNLLPMDRLIVQLGLRYQEWYHKARSPQRWARMESKDITFGPILTVVYAF